jgi:hypothetical protein
VLDVGWAAQFLQRIAVPRLPGSESLRDVEAAIVERLTESGYTVFKDSFIASASPLISASVAGAGFGWTALILVPLLTFGPPGWTVALTGIGAFTLVSLLAVGLYRGWVELGMLKAEAVNIWAKRDRPAVWLVAHSDSKSQQLSLGGRVLAVTILCAGLALMIVALTLRIFTPLPWWFAFPVGVATALGGGALSRATVSNDSPGAVDNATGVLAALVAADGLRTRGDIGVLITGAEEFGMAGAAAWTSQYGGEGMFVNFDSLDSRGSYRVTIHRARAQDEMSGRGQEIANALTSQLTSLGQRVVCRSLPPGILVDGVALARAGMPGVSLSRGDWNTLRVVHTSRDSSDRVDVAAAVMAGRATAAALDGWLG